MLDPNIDLKEELKRQRLYAHFGEGEDTRDLSNTLTLGHGGTGQQRINNMFEGLLQDASNYGINPDEYRTKLQNLAKSERRSDLYGIHEHTKGKKSGLLTYDANQFKGLVGDLFSKINDTKQNALQKSLENKYGQDYKNVLGEGQTFDDFASGAWIDKKGVATQDQTSRMSALRNIMGGQTDTLGTELEGMYGQDTSFFNKLKEDLGKYGRPEVQTGGAVDSRGQTGGGGGAKVIK